MRRDVAHCARFNPQCHKENEEGRRRKKEGGEVGRREEDEEDDADEVRKRKKEKPGGCQSALLTLDPVNEKCLVHSKYSTNT